MSSPFNRLNNIITFLYCLTAIFFIVLIGSSFPEENQNSTGVWTGLIGIIFSLSGVYYAKLEKNKLKISSDNVKQILVKQRPSM